MLKEIFDRTFTFEINYKTNEIFNFADYKNEIVKNFKEIDKRVFYFEENMHKLEDSFHTFLFSSDLNPKRIYDFFLFNIEKNLDKMYENFNSKILNNNMELPSEYRNPLYDFKSIQNRIKDEIIEVSNEINQVFINNTKKVVNEKKFLRICEKIIRFDQFLKNKENIMISQTILNYGEILRTICEKRTTYNFEDFLILNKNILNAYLNESTLNKRYYPSHMTRRQTIIYDLHEIIKVFNNKKLNIINKTLNNKE